MIFLVIGYVNRTANKEEILPASKEIVNDQEEKEEQMTQKENKLPEMQIDKNKTYQAVLSTSAGEITIKLYADKTPITVNNFVYLSQKDFYNQTIFHRTIEDFMIQGGDPEGTGAGGPGYKFDDEPFEYVIFGEVIKGLEVVDKIASASVKPGGEGSTPVNPVTIESVEILNE